MRQIHSFFIVIEKTLTKMNKSSRAFYKIFRKLDFCKTKGAVINYDREGAEA